MPIWKKQTHHLSYYLHEKSVCSQIFAFTYLIKLKNQNKFLKKKANFIEEIYRVANLLIDLLAYFQTGY